MAYKRKIWRFGDSTEFEYIWMGNYGAKGERRAPRRQPTPEEIEKVNQKNREKRLRRLIKANFNEGDMWCTLVYPAGTRKPTEEVKEDVRKFLMNLRRDYKRAGAELKFIYRIEIGSRGGIHVHMLVNRIRDGDLLLRTRWTHGHVNYEFLRRDVRKLAEYISKTMNEEQTAQMELFEPEKKKNVLKYSTSRNLIRPEPEEKEMKRLTMMKILRDGPKPTKGYVIDWETVTTGVNPFTGMSYLHYTEVKGGRDGTG